MVSREKPGWPGCLLPALAGSAVAVAPPGKGQGNWAGAPSSVLTEDGVYLAYRLRRPVGEGRGYAVVVARSVDGVRFQPLLTVRRQQLAAESLERPCLVRTPGGRWRLYLSCATPGTKHWRVELLEAAHPAAFTTRGRLVVLPGDSKTAVKDPVIQYRDGVWQLWASCHPLADPAEADQMTTEYATSDDGLDWVWHGTALAGRPGCWDARGARVTAVSWHGGVIAACYDGRASAAENYEERTGIATGTGPAGLAALGSAAAAESPHGGHGLRYLDVLPLGDGRYRLYYEVARPDGAHELRTEVSSPA